MKYYFPVDSSGKFIANHFSDTNSLPYDIYFGEWDSIKSYFQGSNKPKVGQANNFQVLKGQLVSQGISSIQIQYQDLPSLKIHYLADNETNEKRDSYGRTSLHLAAQSGDIDKVRSVLTQKPELLNSQDCLGLTPLHYAVSYGHIPVVQYLINANADTEVGAVMYSSSPRNLRPLDILLGYVDGEVKLLQSASLLDSSTKQAISECFPAVDCANVRLVMKKDQEGFYRIIQKVEIVHRGPVHGQMAAFYPDHKKNSKQLHFRHRVSADWITTQIQQDLIGRDYRDVHRQLCNVVGDHPQYRRDLNTKFFADFVSDRYINIAFSFYTKNHTKESHNLFSGPKVANMAKGMLIVQLKPKLALPVFTPFKLNIPNNYLSWFMDESDCDIRSFVKLLNGKGVIEVNSYLELMQLWQLAIIDDEDYARPHDYGINGTSPHITALICNVGLWNNPSLTRKRDIDEPDKEFVPEVKKRC